jgi:hypothetical protein
LAGAGTPTPCSVGTYRNLPGAVESDDCLPCPVGYYCGLATGVLDPDNVCPRVCRVCLNSVFSFSCVSNGFMISIFAAFHCVFCDVL